MMSVKVKTEKFKLSIPLPYLILSLGISVAGSATIRRFINEKLAKRMDDKTEAIIIPPLDKKELKSIVYEMKKHRGISLVNVKAKDGTEVVVRL